MTSPRQAKPKLYPYLSFTNRDNLNNSGLIPHASRVSMPFSRGCMRQFDSSDGFTLSVPNQACGCLRDCCFAVSAELNPRAYVFTSCTLSWNFSHIESVTHLSNDHIPLPSPCPAGHVQPHVDEYMQCDSLAKIAIENEGLLKSTLPDVGLATPYIKEACSGLPWQNWFNEGEWLHPVNRIGRAWSLSGPRPFKPLILSPPLQSPMVYHKTSTIPLLQIAWLATLCILGHTVPLACAEFSGTDGLKSATGTIDRAPGIPYLITFASNNEKTMKLA
ncbi:hypothetical protein VNO77_42173 [Canavalia gladiata]|uniref:Uncharacterized protein n=1 Tax=Canavalia gladiata TaxID=3824 RepID=A0AAN9K2T2_CANGL